MSESDGVQQAKRKLSQVTLTQDAGNGDDDERRPIVVGHHVREDVAEKSGLLAGLPHAGGLASLPDDISPEDVQLWQASKVVNTAPSTDELVTVLKVADVLSDSDDGAWADMLVHRVLNTDWEDTACAAKMECALLTLPPHLLTRCLAACAPLAKRMTGCEPEINLFEVLPLTLHQPLMVAAAAANGAISVPTALPKLYLTLLASAEFPSPGLQTMEIHDEVYMESGDRVSPVQAALLARALAAHPSLHRLGMQDVLIAPPVLERFAACLPRGALPRLTELHIHTAEHSGGCAALAGCLKRLPALSCLHIELHQNSNPGGGALASFRRAAASPVTLSSLVSLTIDEEGGRDPIELHDDPNSEELTASGGRHSSITSFLPLFNLPSVTELSLRTAAPRLSFTQFRSALARLPSLCKLEVNADLRDGSSSAPGSQAVGDVLPALHDVTINSQCPLSPLLVAKLAAEMAPRMTSLKLTCEFMFERTARQCTVDEVTDAWAAFLLALGRCTRLQRLRLGQLSGVHSDERVPPAVLSHSTQLAAALRPLTALTELHLGAVTELVFANSHCTLHGSPLGGALSALTALQTLHICQGRGWLEVLEPEHVINACAALTKLTRLRLCMTAQNAPLAELVPKLPALEQLEVGGSLLMHAGGDVEALQARFPNVKATPCGCRRWNQHA